MPKQENQVESTSNDKNEEPTIVTTENDTPTPKAGKGPATEERSSPRLTRSRSRSSPAKEEDEKPALPPLADNNKRDAKESAVDDAQESGSSKKRRV